MPKRFAPEIQTFLDADAVFQRARVARCKAEVELVKRMETYRVKRFVSVKDEVLVERGFGEMADRLSITPMKVMERE